MGKTALKIIEQQDPANNTFDKLHDARCKLAFMSEAVYDRLGAEDYVEGVALGCHLIMEGLGEELDKALKDIDFEYDGMRDC